MSIIYNPYADYRNFTGSYDMMREYIPASPCFTYLGEKEICLYQDEGNTPYPAVINNIVNNEITAFDKKIISLVATYTFINIKQLNECLKLMEIGYTDSVLKGSIEKLRKNNIIRSFRFWVDEHNFGKYYVYSLNKNGSDIAKVLGIPHTYTAMQPALNPPDIRKVLVANQIMLAYIKSGLKIDWLKRGQVITAKDEKSAIVRPSMAVSVDGDNIFIEIVRKGDFWKQYLTDKLTRYKSVFDNWENNSWSLTEQPVLVLCGEDEEHNRQISQLTAELGMEVYFTHDLLNCGANFYHSLYQLTDKAEPDYFCFDTGNNAA